jgi:serine phosphatase RsbU (regulator of sigma subunit)
MHFFGTKEGAQPMCGILASDISSSHHTYEAVKDEARLIQDSLLPAGTLRGPSFEVAYRYQPLVEVGGDFADFFQLPNGLVGLYVGDVVGKGVTAALYAALVMGTIRGINKTGEDPASVLALLNKRLRVRPVPGRYSSTLYALFDPASGELVFSNAGLPLPLLVSAAGCRLLGEGGFPSGMFPDAAYETHRVRLLPGDTVLFATDGLHEMRNEKEEDLSWGKLAEIWKACRRKTADEALDFLFEEVRTFSENGRHHDDITALVLKVPATTAECGAPKLGDPGAAAGDAVRTLVARS